MPTPNQTYRAAAQAAEDAAAAALAVRKAWRRKRRPTDPKRIAEIEEAIAHIQAHTSDLRSLIGRIPWEPRLDQALAQRTRAASQALQDERRKLRKMLP